MYVPHLTQSQALPSLLVLTMKISSRQQRGEDFRPNTIAGGKEKKIQKIFKSLNFLKIKFQGQKTEPINYPFHVKYFADSTFLQKIISQISSIPLIEVLTIDLHWPTLWKTEEEKLQFLHKYEYESNFGRKMRNLICAVGQQMNISISTLLSLRPEYCNCYRKDKRRLDEKWTSEIFLRMRLRARR